MKKLSGVVGLILITMLAGCRSRSIDQIEYYEPTDLCKIEVQYTAKDGTVIKNVKGAIKKETHIKEEGANEFSTGKEFNLNVSGLSL